MKAPSRAACNLPEPIIQRLNAYALAAGAAGVGLLTSAQPAQAKIVYTPANIPIVRNGGPVELDLNHDGINDFQFSNTYYSQAAKRPPEGFVQFALTVAPVQQSNRVRTIENSGILCADRLRKGKNVGPHSPFQAGRSTLPMAEGAGDYTSFNAFGPWLKAKQGYLGLKFMIKGKIHYGWARIRLAGETSPTIVGYAYETIPDKRIITGQKSGPAELGAEQPISLDALPAKTATLDLLAMGAPALSIWRREESAATRLSS